MNAKAPKRKVFSDAVDLLGVDNIQISGDGISMLPIDEIKPFHNHPFRLYEGERLQDMIESIRDHGVLNPVIVRKYNGIYEMLSGHNRQNAAKLAGLSEIPAIVKEQLSDEEAYVYVIETNLMQRSFTDLSISEKAAVLAERYDKVMSQGKKNEIIRELEVLQGKEAACGHCDHKFKSRDGLGEEYGLSGSSVARLLRVNHLIPEFKSKVDSGELQLMAAVQLSYLPEQGQKMALEAAETSGVAINKQIATNVRNGAMTVKAITEAISGPLPEPNPLGLQEEAKIIYKPIKLSGGIREKYFADTKAKDIEGIVDKALESWFKKRRN